jgi:BirA family biotin operon repressor/biotin-[acetyl-CoA-carboxylase] ligase
MLTDPRGEVAAELPVEFTQALTAIRPRLGRLGSPVLFFPVVGSTNDVASALASRGGHEGAVVVAEAQTAGRGRRGHGWFSPSAGGLYVSVVLAAARSRASPDRANALVTLAASVALSEAIEAVTGLRPEIKWPNDLEVGRRKLAGILADGIVTPALETASGSTVSQVVLGFGINVRPVPYPAELQNRATSLELEISRPVDRATLFAESLAALAARYDDLLEGRFDAILDAWRERAQIRRGARVSWDTPAGPQSGVTQDVDEWGALLVRRGDRTERIVAGELRWE